MSNCTADQECPGTLICYVNSPWLLEQGIQSKCSCAAWNSYVGEDCLSLGPGAYFMAFTSGVTLILGILAGYLSARVIYQRVKQDGKLKFSQMMATAIALCLALLSFIGWRICTMIRAVRPELNTIFITENLFQNRKDHQVRFANAVFVVMTVCFLGVAYLGLSLSWIEIAQRVLTFTGSGEKSARQWTILIVLMDFLVLVCGGIGVLVLESTALALLLGVPLLLFVSGTYLYAEVRIVPLLKSLSRGEDHLKISNQSSFIYRIRRTSHLLLLSIVGVFAGGFTYVFLVLFPEGGWRGVSPDGQVSPVLVASETVPAFCLFGAFVIRWFLSRSIIFGRTTKRNISTLTSTLTSLTSTLTKRSLRSTHKAPAL